MQSPSALPMPMKTLLADFFIRHTRSAGVDSVSDCFFADNSKFNMLVVVQGSAFLEPFRRDS